VGLLSQYGLIKTLESDQALCLVAFVFSKDCNYGVVL